jgi:micrococcal nuclease
MFKAKKILGLIVVLLLAVLVAGCKNDIEEGPIELNTNLTDNLKLEASFSGKEFINDGIGEVQLNRVVDGDTITVYTGSQSTTIRFLGIDTPESTAKVEPWGKSASQFVKDKLNDAHSIVLEAEGDRVDSTGRRYLAWIWYKSDANSDYRLLNLEEIELAYSKYMIINTSKYFQTMYDANQKASLAQKRVWGERDPDFNYSKEVIATSILYLVNNPEEFMTGTKFDLTVRLVRTEGNNMYLQDAYEVSYDQEGEVITGFGNVYAFSGYAVQYYLAYTIGDVFTIQAKFEYGGNFGTQLTDLSKASRVIENGEASIVEVDANDVDGGEALEEYDGVVIKLNNLEVTAIKDKTSASGNDYFVVETKNNSGKIFDIYFGNSLITPYDVTSIFNVGDIINVTGGVRYYEFANGGYQISMGDAPRYSQGVLNPLDVVRVNDIVKVD